MLLARSFFGRNVEPKAVVLGATFGPTDLRRLVGNRLVEAPSMEEGVGDRE